MQIQFRRVDLNIRVRPCADDSISVLVGESGSDEVSIKRVSFQSHPWLSTLGKVLPSSASFSNWLERVLKADSESSELVIPRITLEIIDPELASLPWESALAQCIPPDLHWRGLVVRVSAMRPRWAATPFTVPLRILNVQPANSGALPALMRRLIGRSQPDQTASEAVQVHECAFSELESTSLPAGWPTAEIVHFESLPSLKDVQSLLSSAAPERPGTLGWFARVGELWQTRLMIIECRDADEKAAADRLATALLGRAGPAVLVGEFPRPSFFETSAVEFPASPFFNDFYWNLLHDFPIDRIIASVRTAPPDYDFPLSLHAGAGREEALRISKLGMALLELEKELSKAIELLDFEPVSEIRDLVRRSTARQVIEFEAPPLNYDDAGKIVIEAVKSITKRQYVPEDMPLREVGISTRKQVTKLGTLINTYYPGKEMIDYGEITGTGQMLPVQSDWTVGQVIENLADSAMFIPIGTTKAVEQKSEHALKMVKTTLSDMREKWNSYVFEFHESEGFIPVSNKMNEVRKHLAVKGPTTYQYAAAPREPRHVNASLWSADENNEGLRQLDQVTTRLRVGQIYHLGIQIAPKDIRIRVAGETALIEEVFNWSAEMEGVWIEFAVTGLDFDVLGDPVRELWLPRDRPSEMIYFAVSPRKAGACRLRYCLYYRQNVIQSVRLAAMTLDPDQKDFSTGERRKQMAAALDLEEDAIGVAAYLPRLEYSTTTAMESLDSRPPRTMSIVANDLNGKTVISIKGADQFDVLLPGNDLPRAISHVRDTLTQISADKLDTEPDPLKWPYAFGAHADPKTLESALMKLAEAGWRLYDLLFVDKTKKKLETNLAQDGKIISVAHLLLEKVIPWAVLYDRQYKAANSETENAACTAALPDAEGKFPTLECGKHPNCLLNPEQIAKREASPKAPRLDKRNVACPLHFWGFRHTIEIPPQPVESDGKTVAQRDYILSGSKVQMLTGANATLKLWPQHETELKEFNWKSTALRVSALEKDLEDAELDFIYFYCHAGGGLNDPAGYDPYLLFQDVQQAQPEKMHPRDFPQADWSHHPLVFLNGCGTLGFSPDALSPFIKKLVRDLGASGVIGTEITVWEELATEVAQLFLKRFLARKSAGEALLAVRRSLLAKRNPLGLVYTLYAPAQLKLETDAVV